MLFVKNFTNNLIAYQNENQMENGDERQLDPLSMMRITQTDVIPGFLIPADVYVKLPSGKYLVVARKGTKGSLSELHAADLEKSAEFYIRKEDYPACVDQNIKVLTVMMRKAEIPFPRKVQFLTLALDSLYRELFEVELGSQTMRNLKLVGKLMTDTIRESHMVIQVMDQMRTLGSEHVKTAVLTSVLATSMGRQQKMTPEQIEELTLAGLLCDVGYLRLPQELINKPATSLSPIEIALWETHVSHSVVLLKSLRTVSEAVVRMVEEHHELPTGYGFPNGLRDNQMLASSKLIQVAHGVASVVAASRRNPQPLSLLECIRVTDQHELPYSASAWMSFKKSLDLA